MNWQHCLMCSSKHNKLSGKVHYYTPVSNKNWRNVIHSVGIGNLQLNPRRRKEAGQFLPKIHQDFCEKIKNLVFLHSSNLVSLKRKICSFLFSYKLDNYLLVQEKMEEQPTFKTADQILEEIFTSLGKPAPITDTSILDPAMPVGVEQVKLSAREKLQSPTGTNKVLIVIRMNEHIQLI